MPPAAELVFAIVVAVIGAATGWCLRGGGSAQRKPKKDGREIRYAREVLGRLHDLAAHVAADVDEHTSRVEEINEELLSSPSQETEEVVSVVSKLLQANNRMQEQLASADEKLRQQAEQIESKAMEARTDVLTGLANRRAFDAEMAHRLAEFERHGRTFSVIMIDVDRFKSFNDTHGHQAGDAVLSGLGSVLGDSSRELDLVARYGGEEFSIVLPDAGVSNASLAAERVRKTIEAARFRFRATDLHVTVSMGVAELVPQEKVAGLIERADAALYASKEAGRNRVSWHDGEKIQSPGDRSETVEVQQCQARGEASPGEQPQEQPSATPAEAKALAPAERADGEHERRFDRDVFEERLGGRLLEWRNGGVPPAVLLVRIDQYGKITSEHGEKLGESVLDEARKILDTVIGDLEVLARYDVADFAVLLPEADLCATVRIAERLRETIAQCSLPAGDGELQFTVSVSAVAAMYGDETLEVLQRVEEALDAAVKSGGDCSYFHNGQWSEMANEALQSTI